MRDRALCGRRREGFKIGHHHAVIVQAGTATSDKGRGRAELVQ